MNQKLLFRQESFGAFYLIQSLIPTIWFRAWKATLHMSDEMLLMHNQPRQTLEICCCFRLLLVCGFLVGHLKVLIRFFGCHSIQYIDRASSTVLLLEQPLGTMHNICIKQYSKRFVDKEHGESETRELCLANTSYCLGNTRGHINAQDQIVLETPKEILSSYFWMRSALCMQEVHRQSPQLPIAERVCQ